jgi:phosphoglycolate phosphatase
MDDSPLKLCVFDLDGTLIDSQKHILEAMARAFAAEGLAEPDPMAVRGVIGLSLDEAVARLAPELEGISVDRLGERYRDAYFDMKKAGVEAEPLMEGARAVIDALDAAGWQLAIVTGKGRRGLLNVLDSHDLRHRFVSLKAADDGPGKPDPTLLFDAIDEAGSTPAHSVMVGDTSFDLRMARQARVAGIGVSWGYHNRTMLEAECPVAILKQFAELPEVAARAIADTSSRTDR